MYAIANRTEAIVSNQQNSKQKIIIEFDYIDTRDDQIDDCLSAITCSHADQSLNTDESIKSPQRSTTDLPCFHKVRICIENILYLMAHSNFVRCKIKDEDTKKRTIMSI